MRIIHPKAGIQDQFWLCNHLEDDDPDRLGRSQYFTGQGVDYAIICDNCLYDQQREQMLIEVDRKRFGLFDIDDPSQWDGVTGQPEIIYGKQRQVGEYDVHHTIDFTRNEILTVTNDWKTGQLVLLIRDRLYDRMDFVKYRFVKLTKQEDQFHLQEIYEITEDNIFLFAGIDFNQTLALEIISTEKILCLMNEYGSNGMIVDYNTETVILGLNRGSYHVDVSSFPFAFWEYNKQRYAIHGTDWNCIEITRLDDKQCLSQRDLGGFDYFHGKLICSPNGEWVVDDGWVWGPAGVPIYWNLEQWLENPSEPENSQMENYVAVREDWGFPIFWINQSVIMIQGYGGMDGLNSGVMGFEIKSKNWLFWMPGPTNIIHFDHQAQVLLDYYGIESQMRLWDTTNGTLVYESSDYQIIGVADQYILVKEHEDKLKILYY